MTGSEENFLVICHQHIIIQFLIMNRTIKQHAFRKETTQNRAGDELPILFSCLREGQVFGGYEFLFLLHMGGGRKGGERYVW